MHQQQDTLGALSVQSHSFQQEVFGQISITMMHIQLVNIGVLHCLLHHQIMHLFYTLPQADQRTTLHILVSVVSLYAQ